MSKKSKIENEFSNLIKDIKSYNEKADIEKIMKAWDFAKLAHTGQKRLSGEIFVRHPLEVAKILTDWKLDTESIIAALLHDTIEDGGATRIDIEKEFGENIARLVDGVTKVTEIRLKGSKEQEFIENLRKILLVMAKDLRVVLVKLADRLHNLRTLGALSKTKQKENAIETLEVYAPLAERLGIGEVKGELEDLALPYAYPESYKKVKRLAGSYYVKDEGIIKTMRRKILRKLAKEGIKANINARKKHLYSLWKKLERPEVDWDFDKIYDIVAMRVLVDKIAECYSALGVIHGLYKPVPHLGVSDFIAQPKPNGYRSIHTKVFGPKERIVEVQIRTHRMHKHAEYGIAAHWAYSEVKAGKIKDALLESEGAGVDESKLSWVKQLIEWQTEITDSKEFLDVVKFDALTHRNFIFSPKGDVYDLPVNATPVDFAYAIHTDLGNYIKAAKVNGKIVSLDYGLKSGDVCEIIKTKNPKRPNKDWLDFVITTTARRKIKGAVNQ